VSQISQALILAAGEGKRMLPLTKKIPKPLAKVDGTALIDHIINKLSHLPNLQKIVVNSHYLAPILENHLKNLQNNKIIISPEQEKLETGGGLVNAMKFFNKNEPILIINGDLFWQEAGGNFLQKMIASFGEQKMDILLALKKKEDFFGYDGAGDFDLDKNCNVIKRPKNNPYAYIGAQIIHPKILSKAPQEQYFSLNHFFKIAQDKNGFLQGIKGFEANCQAFHIGTVKTLSQVNQIID
jgi:N-acetyl-alpha-D-muramate 1-phosphate uridylyltransferase